MKIKFRATRKQLRENYWFVFPLGYCQVQYLFRNLNPGCYLDRVEGWACDVYEVLPYASACFSTGYAPFSTVPEKVSTKVHYKADAYDKLALMVIDLNRNKGRKKKTYEEQRTLVDKLAVRFARECVRIASEDRNDRKKRGEKVY